MQCAECREEMKPITNADHPDQDVVEIQGCHTRGCGTMYQLVIRAGSPDGVVRGFRAMKRIGQEGAEITEYYLDLVRNRNRN